MAQNTASNGNHDVVLNVKADTDASKKCDGIKEDCVPLFQKVPQTKLIKMLCFHCLFPTPNAHAWIFDKNDLLSLINLKSFLFYLEPLKCVVSF